jgi:hypothetical protein
MGIYDELTKLEDDSPASKPRGAKKRRKSKQKATPKVARKSTRVREMSRDKSRARSRETSREKPRDLPTRDEIQEFTFSLRDDLKVKVQAEVPHQWQDELKAIADELNVKRLELYRFILGEFLGKVQRDKRRRKPT